MQTETRWESESLEKEAPKLHTASYSYMVSDATNSVK